MSPSDDESVLVVDPVGSGRIYAPILERAGVRVHLLDTPRALAAGLRPGPTPGAVDLEADFDSDPRRVRDWCRERGVAYVVTGTESCVQFCDELRADLDLAPRSDMDRPARRWHKQAMTDAIVRAGLPALPTVTVPRGEAVPTEATQRLADEGAVVVKPAVGAGSVDVRVATAPRELADAVRTIHSSAGFFGDHPDALVQQLYPGERREYVVDTFSHGDRHEVVGVSRYDKRLSPTGDFVYERIRWLSPQDPEVAAVTEHAVAVLRALGVGVGAAHLELMDGEDVGPRLVDFGARAHGSGHPLKTHRLTGTSHVHRECEFAASLLSGPARTRTTARTGGPPGRGAIVFFNVDGRSRCVDAPRSEDLLALDGVLETAVHAQVGETYPATRSLLHSMRLGLAFVTAPTDDELDSRCDRVREVFAAGFRSAA